MAHVCQGCGETISDAFYRVFYSEGAEVTECIHCPESRANGFRPPEAPSVKETRIQQTY